MRTTDRILERLLSLHPKVIDLSLDRMYDILEKLGNPHHHLPPVIHVAGTNGKGSTISYIRSILEKAKLSIHVYTSPHLVRFNERIRLGGKLIDEEYLQEILEYCETVNKGEPITYFEITTAAAFKAFADNPADVLILEVGLGGRLDATNVIDKPLCSVITPVSLDHEQFLGSEIKHIANEKAHIA
ncbi:Mur ligase family protein, partial [Emcibacteraceae bacterium]|nr:Mur ligase family protein [Emcibacteraceae bacterium]